MTNSATSESKPAPSITIIARRWFHRGPGNTYHSAEILVNGACVHKIEFAYGYGEQYEWNAAMWLEENGYLPGREHYKSGGGESLWRYCEKHGITLAKSCADVQRKKDL
jgi:hypothetical protein